jgi:symplekin
LLLQRFLTQFFLKQGHELTICILNRLYHEAEQDHDFLSSRTATSVYESFLLNIVCTLKFDVFVTNNISLAS